MMYKYREKFEQDGGFRLFRDRVSVLGQSNLFGRRLTAQQNLLLAKRLDDYIAAISGLGNGPLTPDSKFPDTPLTKADFIEVDHSAPFYKYVNDTTWNYLRSGSFQFGTAEFYRNQPNIEIQDQREGYGHFHLVCGHDQLTMSLVSGYNCAIYCGTDQIDGSNDDLMRTRFGRKRIKIEPVGGFIARAKKCIGAYRSRIYDVVYRDIKSLVDDFSDVRRFIEIAGQQKLSHGALHKLNKAYFSTFYEYGLLPGIYSKPKRYSQERERRLIFETKRDIRLKPIIIDDKTLLDFITFLGE
jgi:hypothetical protein